MQLKGKPVTSRGEMLKYFGIMILSTRFEFGARRDLWSTKSSTKYIPAPAFGQTGMSRNRFDDIWSSIVWSKQAAARGEDQSHEGHRWELVEHHVANFNSHRKIYVRPSSVLCVDESISRWYGLGGHWINLGLPMYVAMERKPEDGGEIQDVCDGTCGILLGLKIVKTESERARLEAAR